MTLPPSFLDMQLNKIKLENIFSLSLNFIFSGLFLSITACTVSSPERPPAAGNTILPSAPKLDPPVISLPASSLYFSNTSTLSISGTCTAGPGAKVFLGGDEDKQTPCSSNGDFSFAVNKSNDGTFNYTLRQESLIHHPSDNTSLAWKRSTVPPSPLTITVPSSYPVISGDSTFTIVGACIPGLVIDLIGDSTQRTNCSAGGNYSFTVSKSVDGTFIFDLYQTDIYGNPSSKIETSWKRDTVVPSPPLITAPVLNPYTSNESVFTLSGTCANGTTIKIAGDMTDSTFCSAGVFSMDIQASAYGTFNYSLVAVGSNNLPSTQTTFQWVRTGAVPPTPILASPLSNPLYNNLNNLVISGTCVDGYTVYLSGSQSINATCASSNFSFTASKNVDGTYNFSVLQSFAGQSSGAVEISWIRDTVSPLAPIVILPGVTPYFSSSKSLLISGSCDNGNAVNLSGDAVDSVSCSSGGFSFTVNKNSDGVYNFNIGQTDPAGNNSSSSASVQWIVDSTQPAAPTIVSPAVSPFVSNANSLTINGGCENSATVYLAGSSTSSIVCSGNQYSFTVSKSTDGTYNYSVSQTDLAGLTSSSKSMQWIRDTVAPSAPTITNPAQNPLTSNDTDLTISGSCESGATINYSGALTGTTACSLGTFSFGISKNVDGVYNVAITQTDAANNTSSSKSFQWTRLSTIPQTPTVTTPASNPYYSRTNSVTLSGSCATGNTVQLSGAQSDTVTCSSNSYSFNLIKGVDGHYTYSISQVNASSVSSGAASFDWFVDTSAPANPVIVNPVSSTVINSANSLVISGNCEANATIHYSGSATGTTACGSGSTFSFSVNKTTDGFYSFSINQIDLAGNSSGFVSVNWQRDTLAPSVPTLSQPNMNPYTSGDSSVAIAGSCEADAVVNLTGGSTQQATCSASESYSFVVSKTTDGTYNFNITQTDKAGNISSGLDFQWLRDTSIPFTPVVISPATSPFYSNDSTISISVTCQTGLSPQSSMVSLTGVDSASVISPAGILDQSCTISPVTYVIQKNVDGDYSFTFSQTNPNNTNTSADAIFNWYRDTVTPSAPIVTSPAVNPYTGPDSITLAGNCETDALVNVSGDATQNVLCANGQFSFSIIKSIDATYNFSITQTDLAGNVSTASSLSWVRNSNSLPPPTITSPILNPYSSNLSNLVISGECEPQYTITISGNILDSDVTEPTGSLTQTCSSAGTYSFSIAKLTDGVFNFQLRESFNSATSAPISFSWTRDTTAPSTTISTTAENPNLATSMSLSFSSNETATYKCSLNGSTYQICSSPISYSGLANGAQTFSVIATDSVGNIGSAATYSWTQTAYNSVAIYHLNAGSGAALNDSGMYTSSNAFSNNLSSFGSPTSNSSGKFPSSSPSSFNLGTGKYFSVANNASLNSTASTMTVEGWFLFNNLPSSTGQYYSLFSNSENSPNLGWELSLEKKNSGGCSKYKLVFNASLNGTTRTALPSTSCISVSTNRWYYVAITWNKGTVKFYMSSTGATSRGTGVIGTAGSSVLWKPNVPFRIGANATSGTGSSLWLDGAVDEVRISNITRTITAPTTEYTAD